MIDNLSSNESEQSNQLVVIKTTDICAKGRHLEDILSNFCNNDFCYDGVQCKCMAAFLQSLKYKDEKQQRDICFTFGDCVSKYSNADWQKDQIVWWKGLPMDRQSPEYLDFVNEAYQSMFLWCGRFRNALMETEGKQLLYDSGRKDPYKTILTDQEFCKILTDLREHHKGESLNYPRMWPSSYGVDEDYE
ncbi:MAG: hypothetical protein DBY35_08580 [Bacteroidales bacterium]|nr:MAG: hypothetical protein DBY35_08580 [Bacteroidales bacterium]